jgi:hypothetical protein
MKERELRPIKQDEKLPRFTHSGNNVTPAGSGIVKFKVSD